MLTKQKAILLSQHSACILYFREVGKLYRIFQFSEVLAAMLYYRVGHWIWSIANACKIE